MAGKKKEINLQVSITSEEQWIEMLATKGLTVVDVYQQWCGPCRAVVSLFRKIKNELGDDLLHFATAQADCIDALEKYRGKCEPTSLFYGGGELVAVLRGANAPLLQRMVVEELAKEKQALEHKLERRIIKDEGLADEEEEENDTDVQQNDEDVLVPANKPYTVAIIKPDVVAHGKTNEIIMKIQDAGFEILAHEERTLSETEARDFYQHKATEACFEELVQFMSSGPSHVLIISKMDGSEDVVPAWREVIGPADIEQAKSEEPDSLRAQYGTETLFNALHGSDDADQASRELAFFFPKFRMAPAPDQGGAGEGPVERTLALIRPDVARENRDEIVSRIKMAGFTIAMQKEVLLTEHQVKQFYSHHQEEDYFPALLKNMLSGPVLALALVRREAVELWRRMLGPKEVAQAREEKPDSLRAQFSVEGETINQIHGSQTLEEAEQEINFFFPKEETLAVIKPDAMENHKEEILEEIRVGGFDVSCLREMVLTRDMAEEFYREHQHKPFFSQLVEFMCQGPCMMLILTKENAVEEWRALMGPTDPDKAKDVSPQSLRARFAKDILENSVHGSSSRQHADDKIQFIFGDITVKNDVLNEADLEPLQLGEGQDSCAELKQLEASQSSCAELMHLHESCSPEPETAVCLDTERQAVTPNEPMPGMEQEQTVANTITRSEETGTHED